MAVKDPREKFLSPSPSPNKKGDRGKGNNSLQNSPVPDQAGGIFATEGVEEMRNSPMRSPVRSTSGIVSPRTVALQRKEGNDYLIHLQNAVIWRRHGEKFKYKTIRCSN